VFNEYDHVVVPVAVAYVPLSTLTWTFATPRLSDAVPLTTTVPLTVVPDLGALMEMPGFWVSVVCAPSTLPVRTGMHAAISVAESNRTYLAIFEVTSCIAGLW
jgi:hypothetical protein